MEDYKVLAQALVPLATGIIYTVPVDVMAIVKHIVVANPSGGALNFSMFVNGSAALNTQYPPIPIAAGAYMENDSVFTLAAGDTIQALGSGAGLVMSVYGVEIS